MSKVRLVAVTVVILGLCFAACSSADSCQPYSVGVDTSLANVEPVVWVRHSWNQLFVADDTLISSITVWRPARNDSMGVPMKLYVLGVDSSLGLQRPDTKRILLDGPDIVVPGGDGIHPIQCTWTIDPPLSLPKRGQYAFQVKADVCGGGFLLEGTTLNPYPNGGAWQTDVAINCIGTGCCPQTFPWSGEMDLIFQVEFCTFAVPTLPATWGRVKASYR